MAAQGRSGMRVALGEQREADLRPGAGAGAGGGVVKKASWRRRSWISQGEMGMDGHKQGTASPSQHGSGPAGQMPSEAVGRILAQGSGYR